MRANIGLNINFLKRILGPLQILKRIEDMNNVWNKSIGTSYTCIAWEITLHDRGVFFLPQILQKYFSLQLLVIASFKQEWREYVTCCMRFSVIV